MIRPITIHPAVNGYICNVGCQQVVFESREAMLTALTAYLTAPEETEKRFLEKSLNKPKTGEENQMLNRQAPEPACYAQTATEAPIGRGLR